MGKKGFRGRNRRNGGGGDVRQGGERGYAAMKKENEKFQNYYDNLLQLDEEEKAAFWEALRRELPNSFRFCGSKGHAQSVQRLLKTRYIPEIVKIEHQDGRPVEPPQPVPWYPNEFAWSMTTPKNVVRKFPPFAAFQKFLVSETSVGNISRQEVVSMIPPLLMDLKPGHVVLDMCAAPGSKAAQLVEFIHRGEEARVRKVLRAFAKEDGLDLGKETEEEANVDLEADPSDAGRATGLLIANDADYKRSHMLVHQLKRLSSPNLMVTNHDATMFPSIRVPNPNPSKISYLKFDRILADVPCSGDGTMRKNANLWNDWQSGSALGLHITQIRILVRALQILKVGGRVVYSTCSMNPVENEAVIGAAIERCGGPECVEIVDCKDQLPELKRKPGLKSWNIIDKAGKIWNSWEEVQESVKESQDGALPGRVAVTMFPQPASSSSHDLPLERCMRVYAHMQDTGGFFITVLEKKKEFKAKNEKEPKQSVQSNGEADTAPAAKSESKPVEETIVAKTEESAEAEAGVKAEGESAEAEAGVKAEGESAEAEAVEPKSDGDTTMNDALANGAKRPLQQDESEEPPAKKVKSEDTIKAEAGLQQAPKPGPPGKKRNGAPPEEPFKYLDPSHPIIQNIKEFYKLSTRFPDDRYMVRNEMGEPAKAIYYTSALTRDILTENEGRGVKFIHGGVRMYMKQDAPSAEVCRWRIQAEGMPILQGYVGEPRIVHLHKKETLRRLLIEMFPRISDGKWRDFDEIGERVRDIGMGCCVLRIEPEEGDPEFTEAMALPLWKSIHSLNLMLPKEDRSAMLLRIFNDVSPLINLNKQKPAGGRKEDKVKEEADDQPEAEDDEGPNYAAVEDLPTPE